MPLYEHVVIARQDVSQAQVDTLIEEMQTILTDNGGTVVKTEPWGLRTMQYKIRKNRKGHYTLLQIDAPAAAVAEMERQMRINEDILRFMTLRVDEHPTNPSPILVKRDRDDRRGGRGRDRGGRGGDRDRGDRDRDRGDRGGDRDRGDRAPRAEAAGE
ncbi:MAG: 30S ribosomal protein S6 [Pseudomonadota bacterium]